MKFYINISSFMLLNPIFLSFFELRLIKLAYIYILIYVNMNCRTKLSKMSTSQIKIKHILNMLTIQTTKNDNFSVEDIDIQFISLLKTVEIYFREQEYELLFEWLAELVKKELELKHKQQSDYRIYKKDSINLLICKVNLFHARIIEMLIDEIDIAYQDYLEMKESNPEFAQQIKFSTLAMVNEFITHLTGSRAIDEAVFDQYIELISQSLQIFNI